MSTLSVRLPEDLERRLETEARLAQRGRSELVREAVQEYLARHEQDRFMREMVAEMKDWLADKTGREESRELAAEAPDDDLDSVIESERAAGIDPDQRWWK